MATRTSNFRKGKLRTRGRAALLWGFVFFAGFQIAYYVFLRKDPWTGGFEFPANLALLRERLSEGRQGPLLIALGSSHVAMGFRPSCMRALKSSGYEGLTPFNCAMFGSGPVGHLICLRRLLADGIQPDLLMVEVWPPFLTQNVGDRESASYLNLHVNALEAQELSLVCRYHPEPANFFRTWCAHTTFPWFYNRFVVQSKFIQPWLSQVHDVSNHSSKDRWGHVEVNGHLVHGDRETFRKRVDPMTTVYRPLLQEFRLSYSLDAAQRALLRLAREKNIPVMILLMPQTSDFRNCYSPRAKADLNKYLAGLSDEYGATVVDAQDWISDEYFCDATHLIPEGASIFTERFEERAILPFLAKRSFAQNQVLPNTQAD